MDEASARSVYGFPLNAPNDPSGISFGVNGPAIGPVLLLRKIDDEFEVRSADELTYVLGLAFDKPFDIARYEPALQGVARALNKGDLGQAMLRVQLMRLPVLPDAEALRRAVEAEDLVKASPDDPKHPGYPKGAPDGRGGQFRPKSGAVGEELEQAAARRMEKLVARRAFRAGLRRILTPKAGLRLLGEVASNVDPLGPAEIGDALMVEQAGETLAELAEIREEGAVATEFVKKAPWDIEDLYVSKDAEAFDNMSQFRKTDEIDDNDLEKRFGSAKPGYEYHHIAEQSANGRMLSPRELNSTTNIVEIPKLVHEEITSEFKMNQDIGGIQQSLRTSLKGKSFAEHREAGIALMRRMGIIN